jgi:hypothetical protein
VPLDEDDRREVVMPSRGVEDLPALKRSSAAPRALTKSRPQVSVHASPHRSLTQALWKGSKKVGVS